MERVVLSKSRYLNGLQCPKLLWIAINEPERIPEPDAATQHIFDQGHLVGELAKKLFPGGIDIPAEHFMDNIKETKDLLCQRKPLFEGGFLAGNLFARADILNPVNEGEWDIIEVKSSTSVKDVNIHDVAFQKYCYEQAGLEINRCFLMHINNQYVRNGDIAPQELFKIDEITDLVEEISHGIHDRIDNMFEDIARERCPEIGIGLHCRDPYECALADCWDFLPGQNIFNLYYGGKKCFALYDSGIFTVKEIPDSYKLNGKQCIQRDCEISGQPYIDKEAIREFLDGLEYPLYYLDFETFSTAVPIFDGTKPYQNIPFQFSLHIQTSSGAAPVHHWYLADGPQDPRPELLASLRKSLGPSGSVIAYNKSFEERALNEMANAFPEYADWVAGVTSRLEDLIVPFRAFTYYHPSQKGSGSLKKVLPAVTGQGYEGMAIADGGEASLKYLDITFSETAIEEREKTREDLLAYCGLDTEGMVRIVERLMELVS